MFSPYTVPHKCTVWSGQEHALKDAAEIAKQIVVAKAAADRAAMAPVVVTTTKFNEEHKIIMARQQ